MKQVSKIKKFNSVTKLQSNARFIAIVALVAVTGSTFVFLSHAATSSSALEVEGGTVSGSATTVADSAASNGQAIQFGVATPVTPAGSNPFGSTGARSGMTFNDGIWALYRTGSAASYTSTIQYAEAQRGRPSDFNMGAQYNNTWGDITGLQILSFLNDYSAPVSILMLPPWPNGQGTWSGAAAGTYDTYYKAMGAQIVAIRPNAKTVLRFAWEANGNWYDWSIVSKGGAAAFIAGWDRAVTDMRAGAGSKASNIVFDYSLSGLDNKGQGDPLTATYPGDAYVDDIGEDIYDDNGSATTSDTVPGFESIMDTGYNFAVAHGKSFSLDEWGLHHTGAGGEGGDNPHFINAMFFWIRAHKAHLGWEQYFQDDALNNVNSSLFSPNVNNNPNSRAAYLNQMKTP